ncbi:hypothetical protein GCM10020254_68390 [Streptomyces goshikiensis]
MPCSEDMIERPSRFSVSTPRAFMATSDIPAVAPVDEEHEAERRQVRGQAREDQGQGPQRQQPAQRGAGAEAVVDPARERHRERGAQGGEGEGQAQGARAELRVLLDPRDAGGEGAGHRAVGAEDGGDGVAGTAQPRRAEGAVGVPGHDQ